MQHSQDLKALVRRQRREAKLLAAGASQVEIMRKVGVSVPTVMRWERARQNGGMEALRRAPHFGRPERLIEATSTVEMVDSSVWWLRGWLAWSVQRPAGP